VLPRPLAAAVEDGPAVRVLADEEGALGVGHAAARLRRMAVETRLPIGVGGEDELPAAVDPPGKEAELAVHVAADARGEARRIRRQARGIRRIRVDEGDPRPEGLP